ncbi:hypothetical protein [Bacillus sp. 1P06AnD]|uniref:hypothetical protein n=1 Tax=Bacillus sp. 1P06AnD TaxID=3132208 RepID=UPI0039A128A0
MRGGLVEFSAIGTAVTVVFLMVVNWLTTPDNWWSLYPCFFMLFYPLSFLCQSKKGYQLYSILSSLLLLIFFVVINLRETPDYYWFLYIVAPLIMWPITAFAGKKATSIGFSIWSAFGLSAYYIVLNIVFEPRFLWCIFPVFALLWWPISRILGRYPLPYACISSLLTIVFFVVLNAITTPGTIWAIYPIFAVLWWPLSVYYFIYKPSHVNRK